MTSSPSRALLAQRLGELELAFDNLAWAVTQGKPREDAEHALADHYESQANDLLAMVHEARAAAAGLPGTANGPDGVELAQALATCQDRFNSMLWRYYGEAAAYERRRSLDMLRRQRREWASWVEGVEDALAACIQPLYGISAELLATWQDALESSGRLSISLQASGGSQTVHVHVREDTRTN